MVNIYFTFRFGKYTLYFRFGEIFISQGVVYIYTLAWNLVDIHNINSGTWKHTLYLGIQLNRHLYFGMSVNINGTLYLLKLTININFIMGLDKHTS